MNPPIIQISTYHRRTKRKVRGRALLTFVAAVLGGLVGCALGYYVDYKLVGFDPLSLAPRVEYILNNLP